MKLQARMQGHRQRQSVLHRGRGRQACGPGHLAYATVATRRNLNSVRSSSLCLQSELEFPPLSAQNSLRQNARSYARLSTLPLRIGNR